MRWNHLLAIITQIPTQKHMGEREKKYTCGHGKLSYVMSNSTESSQSIEEVMEAGRLMLLEQGRSTSQ
jgi:membrane-bound inhibitor of C-type lysozyme